MGGLQWWHIVIIVAVFILLFGAKKLPDAARGVGRSLRILKAEVSAMHDEDKKPGAGETDATAAVATPVAQLAPTATPTVPVAAPVVQAPVVAAQAPVAAAAVPVNGVVTEHRAS